MTTPAKRLCKGGCGQAVTPPQRKWCTDPLCKERWLAWHFYHCAKDWVLKRDRGICAYCGVDCLKVEADYRQAWEDMNKGRLYELKQKFPLFRPGRVYYEFDHIKERAAGGDDTPENLQTLCAACHLQKTVLFNERRKKDRESKTCKD